MYFLVLFISILLINNIDAHVLHNVTKWKVKTDPICGPLTVQGKVKLHFSAKTSISPNTIYNNRDTFTF